jgi:hypothetical protein
MWAKLGRRALDFAVGFFALLGFVWVPLGQRTAFEHVKAIFTSRPAVDAGRELGEAATRVRRRLFGGHAPAGPGSSQPAEAAPSGSAEPHANSKRPARREPVRPRPKPPPMAHASSADAGADASLPWPET